MDKATIDWMLANLPSIELTDEAGQGIGRYITPPARLSFHSLDKPRAMEEGQKPKYGCSLIFPAEANLDIMKTAAGTAAMAFFGPKIEKAKQAEKFSPFRQQKNETWDGYGDDGLFIRISSEFPIVLLGEGGESDLIALPNPRWYDGMWVRAQVNVYAYEHKLGGPGVRFGAISVQKIADDEEFKGGTGSATVGMGAIKLPGAAVNSSAPATAPKTAGANLF